MFALFRNNISLNVMSGVCLLKNMRFSVHRGKRPAIAANGSNNNIPSKKGRGSGGLQNQLVNRALQGLSHGGRGGGRGGRGGRGRGWGGRGRGRGYR